MGITLWLLAICCTGFVGLVPGLTGLQKMCTIACLIFVITKAHTLINFCRRQGNPILSECILWFIAWPDLDADGFFAITAKPDSVGTPQWLAAFFRAAGGSLLLSASFYSEFASSMIRGWLVMMGAIFVLHFGSFHLIALGWKIAGRSVVPIMDAPTRSTSLAEFWGRRWNLAFRDYSHRFVFRPAARRWNTSVATWCVFVFSGLVHELAISVPAGAGFGWPLGYFFLQGLGVSAERQLASRGVSLRGTFAGWCFTAACTIPGAFLLFHYPFVSNVVMPLIQN